MSSTMAAVVASSNEQPQRLSDAAPSLIDRAPLCVAAAYAAHGGDPPARLLSLVGHAIRLHRFSNDPFPGTAPGRARYDAADRARCLQPYEPARSSRTGRIRCEGARLVAGSRRNRRTSGCAEGPSPSQYQGSRCLPSVSMEIDRGGSGARAGPFEITADMPIVDQSELRASFLRFNRK